MLKQRDRAAEYNKAKDTGGNHNGAQQAAENTRSTIQERTAATRKLEESMVSDQ
jgi:hypothetical protein